MKTTTTVMGDTWDTIAQRVYGNTLRTQELMEAPENIRLLGTQVFPGGVVVATPEVIEEIFSLSELPEWRR